MKTDQLICNGKYRLIHLLGEGGCGEVWLAEEVDSQTQVAIKTARVGDELTRRFEIEIKLSRKLDHPHLLRADTIERDGDARYLVMPYAEGGSLKKRLSEGALPAEKAVQIANDIASALGYMHGKDIVHRDIHPGNILFTKEGVVKLADLGVAQSKESGTELYGSSRTVQPGNPLYLPPEAFAKSGAALLPLYPAADVYMLGAVLWEMLTGRLYYHTKNNLFNEHNPDVPKWLGNLLTRMLSEDLGNRPGNGEAAAALLQAASAQALQAADAAEKPRLEQERRNQVAARQEQARQTELTRQKERAEKAGKKLAKKRRIQPKKNARREAQASQRPPWLRWGGMLLGLVGVMALVIVLFDGLNGSDVVATETRVTHTQSITMDDTPSPIYTSTYTSTATENAVRTLSPTKTATPSLSQTQTNDEILVYVVNNTTEMLCYLKFFADDWTFLGSMENLCPGCQRSISIKKLDFYKLNSFIREDCSLGLVPPWHGYNPDAELDNNSTIIITSDYWIQILPP